MSTSRLCSIPVAHLERGKGDQMRERTPQECDLLGELYARMRAKMRYTAPLPEEAHMTKPPCCIAHQPSTVPVSLWRKQTPFTSFIIGSLLTPLLTLFAIRARGNSIDR